MGKQTFDDPTWLPLSPSIKSLKDCQIANVKPESEHDLQLNKNGLQV